MIRKKTMRLLCVLAACLMIFGLVGCASLSQKMNEYTSESGMYSVSLPGEWKDEGNDGEEDTLNLSRKDGMSASVIGIPKRVVISSIKNLDDFIKTHKDSMGYSSQFSMELGDKEELTMEGMKACEGYSGTISDRNSKQKASMYIMYAESDNAYYAMMFSSSVGFKTQMRQIKNKVSIKELNVPKTSDTIRWFNATYALLTLSNGGNTELVGGFPNTSSEVASEQEMLSRDWGISDQYSADDNYNWLMTEGHNKDALDELNAMGAEQMQPEDFKKALGDGQFSDTDQIKLQAAYDAYAAHGDQAIKAWDYSRAMSVTASCYLADYYTYEEAMDKLLDTALQIQKTYTSWDDFMDSYLEGYLFWSGDDPTDPNSNYSKRKSNYEELKGEADGPFSLDWNLEFKKEW